MRSAGILHEDVSAAQIGLDCGQLSELFVRAQARAGADEQVLAVWSGEFPRPGAPPSEAGIADFDDCLRRAESGFSRVFFWQSRWTGLKLVAVGDCLDVSPSGPERFAIARDAWRSHAGRMEVGGSGIAAQPGFPILMGGFAFEPGGWHPIGALPDALLWCPALWLVRMPDGSTHLCVAASIRRDSDIARLVARSVDDAMRWLSGRALAPHRTQTRIVARIERPNLALWRNIFDSALTQFKQGVLRKVVLAREVRLQADQPFDVPGAVDYLSRQYDQGAVFAAKFGGRWFLGATPECLVRVARGEVIADSIAGTAPRGRDTEEDEAIAEALISSEKIRREQGIVTQFLTEALLGECRDATVCNTPQIMRLQNVQHLFNAVRTRIADAALFDLAALLHPTPAVGGHPREDALSWIESVEPFDRGWYAAPIGWCDAGGDGELAVAIRSALINGCSAALYAGVGLVAGSNADEEFSETELKLRAMLSALGVDQQALSATLDRKSRSRAGLFAESRVNDANCHG